MKIVPAKAQILTDQCCSNKTFEFRRETNEKEKAVANEQYKRGKFIETHQRKISNNPSHEEKNPQNPISTKRFFETKTS